MATISGVWTFSDEVISNPPPGTYENLNIAQIGNYYGITRIFVDESHNIQISYTSNIYGETNSYAWIYTVAGFKFENCKIWDFGANQVIDDALYEWIYENCQGSVPLITGITLNATEVSLYRGEQFQFEATVEGTGDFDPGVIYSIVDIDATTSTAVEQTTGLFTVGEDETKSTIRIMVQSVEVPDVFVIATVTVLDSDDPGGDEGGGDVTIPDIMPVYRRTGGAWVKLTAYQRQSGKWVLISTAGG